MSLKKIERKYLSYVATELFYLKHHVPANSVKRIIEAFENGNAEALGNLKEKAEMLLTISERVEALEDYFLKNVLKPNQDSKNESKRILFATIQKTADPKLREELCRLYKMLDD